MVNTVDPLKLTYVFTNDAEDDWLLKRYNKSKSIETLATLHKRTPSAIAIRLKEFKIYV